MSLNTNSISANPPDVMVDNLTPAARTENMRRIRSKNTQPEMVVRRWIHAAGLRYRLHKKGLPGRPDLIFPSRRVCLFVHGCFWHGCPKCVDGTRTVKSRTEYWNEKVSGNQERDARHRQALENDGWAVFVIWECETKDPNNLVEIVNKIRELPTQRVQS